MHKIELKEEDSSMAVGVLTAGIFTVILVMYLFSSKETKEAAGAMIWLVLIVALIGWGQIYDHYKSGMIFEEDGIRLVQAFGKNHYWAYSDVSEVIARKKMFMIYDASGRRAAVFGARLDKHPEIVDLLEEKHVPLQMLDVHTKNQ